MHTRLNYNHLFDSAFFNAEFGINGTNLELVNNKLIIQRWRAEENAWPEAHFSKVIFELIETENGTRIKFTQEDLPKAVAVSIAKGWNDFYWNPMIKYFAKF